MTITIVTCYFKIKSKFPSEQYYEWMKNFFKIPMNLIVFTDEESFDYINTCRNDSKITIITDKITNLVMYKHIDYLKLCNEIDYEKIHTPELYLLWLEKPYFIKKAIELNPYNSEWFLWVDIGVCRNQNTIHKYMTFPNQNEIMKYDINKIIYSQIKNFKQEDELIDDKGIPVMFYYKNLGNIQQLIRIQGGFWGIHIDMIDTFLKIYEETYNTFICNNIFIGKDQYLMYTMYLKYKHLFQIVDARDVVAEDVWFSFLERFA
jgi:hypothetical protein